MVFHKIDTDSSNTITSALNFFNVPPTNTSVSSSEVRQILTLNPINDRPFHFKIHSSTSYLDLSKTYIFTEMRIRKLDKDGNWGNIDDNEEVGVINMIGATFIKNIKISINGREIYDSNSLYAYKAYLDALLSYPISVKDSQLQAAGYFLDSDSHEDSTGNQGYISRKGLFASNNIVQFIAKIDSDLFNQELYLINNTEVDIEITPNDDSFVIIAPSAEPSKKYKLEIMQCKLYIKTLELMDGLALDVAKKLDTNIAKYAVRKSIIKSIFITEGRTELNVNLFADQVPRRIIIGIVSNAAFIGSKTLSPFMFKPFDIREITITANGHNYPAVPYDLNFSKNCYVRAFHDLNETLGMTNTTESNGISLHNFKNSCCLFGFNLTNSMEDNACFDLIKNGTTILNIKFSKAVPAGGLALIALAEVDSMFMIDRNRTISSDTTI